TNSTDAMAVDSAYLNSSSRATINTGAISVFNGRFPDTKTTEPYSPSARANANANPVINTGNIDGKMMRRTVSQRVAPRTAAASSSSASMLSKTGCTARTTNGKPINTITTTTASRL